MIMGGSGLGLVGYFIQIPHETKHISEISENKSPRMSREVRING